MLQLFSQSKIYEAYFAYTTTCENSRLSSFLTATRDSPGECACKSQSKCTATTVRSPKVIDCEFRQVLQD